jgi:hypothetical protein
VCLDGPGSQRMDGEEAPQAIIRLALSRRKMLSG